jgi:hypothetical protein
MQEFFRSCVCCLRWPRNRPESRRYFFECRNCPIGSTPCLVAITELELPRAYRPIAHFAACLELAFSPRQLFDFIHTCLMEQLTFDLNRPQRQPSRGFVLALALVSHITYDIVFRATCPH